MWYFSRDYCIGGLITAVAAVSALRSGSRERFLTRQLPAEPTGVKTIISPNGFDIRYSEPGASGVCETTPGVRSYSGYIDLDAQTHMFFWFFEARDSPDEAPITLWLEGGPGGDSMFGLFDLVGPCHVAGNMTTFLNPDSFTEASNVLFLSQPLGVGFSYQNEVVGIINDTTLFPQSSGSPDGRYADADILRTMTSSAAAVPAWEILQAFFQELPVFDSEISSRDFNLWTLSYGGHYGPAFLEYFDEQNEMIRRGKSRGISLNMISLGIFNGIIDIGTQMPYYPEYAYKNHYGIKLVNETVYDFMKLAFTIPGGCYDSLQGCYGQDLSTRLGQYICSTATAICRSTVEGPAESDINDRSYYDIRAPRSAEPEPSYWETYLNSAFVQNAIGVDLNYTSPSSTEVAVGFAVSGDWALNKIPDIERLLDHGVRVALIYGDADYLANWMGGEAISLAVNYTYSAEFRLADYVPFKVHDTKYGETRQYGNLSFTRMYEAGHDVPFYQPVASLELFKRVLHDLTVADGSANGNDE